MNLDGVFIPLGEAFHRRIPSMGRGIVSDPKDSVCRAIWLLVHDEIHQTVKCLNSCFPVAKSQDSGPSHIPCSQISKGTGSFVFEFYPAQTVRFRRFAGNYPLSGLNAGFLISADHVIIVTKRLALPNCLIKIKDRFRFFGEVGITRPNPTPIGPGFDGIGTQPTPDSGVTDGGDDTALYSLLCNFMVAKTRERQPKFLWKLLEARRPAP